MWHKALRGVHTGVDGAVISKRDDGTFSENVAKTAWGITEKRIQWPAGRMTSLCRSQLGVQSDQTVLI